MRIAQVEEFKNKKDLSQLIITKELSFYNSQYLHQYHISKVLSKQYDTCKCYPLLDIFTLILVMPLLFFLGVPDQNLHASLFVDGCKLSYLTAYNRVKTKS